MKNPETIIRGIMKEAVNPSSGVEGDYEGDMARGELHAIISNAQDLLNEIGEKSELEAWVQSKITKAADYISSVRNYMQGQKHRMQSSDMNEQKDAVVNAVVAHIGSKNPKKVAGHFKRDEKAAKKIVKLARSMEEALDINALRDATAHIKFTPKEKSSEKPKLDLNRLAAQLGGNKSERDLNALRDATLKPEEGPKPIDEAKGRSNYLYGINHVQTGAHRDIIKLPKTLGYGVSIPGGSSGTMKVRTPEGRLVTQITTDGGPGGNRRALVDIHRHQIEIGGFNGMDHTHDTIRDTQRGILEEIEQLNEKKSAAWQRKEGKDPEGGLNKKGVESYRRENPGSNLQTAVTTEPSKLKPGSKKAKRRLSFCRRMKGMKRKLTSAKTARDPDSRINKSLRKWNCE